MTNKEAIEKIKSAFAVWEEEYGDGLDWSKEHEARDMAIKALENDKTEVVRCKGCKHWDIEWTPDETDLNEHYCPYADKVTKGEFYCADGEEQEHE